MIIVNMSTCCYVRVHIDTIFLNMLLCQPAVQSYFQDHLVTSKQEDRGSLIFHSCLDSDIIPPYRCCLSHNTTINKISGLIIPNRVSPGPRVVSLKLHNPSKLQILLSSISKQSTCLSRSLSLFSLFINDKQQAEGELVPMRPNIVT